MEIKKEGDKGRDRKKEREERNRVKSIFENILHFTDGDSERELQR